MNWYLMTSYNEGPEDEDDDSPDDPGNPEG